MQEHNTFTCLFMPFISHFYVYVHILRGERKRSEKIYLYNFLVFLSVFFIFFNFVCLLTRSALNFFLFSFRLKTICYLNDVRVSSAILTKFMSFFTIFCFHFFYVYFRLLSSLWSQQKKEKTQTIFDATANSVRDMKMKKKKYLTVDLWLEIFRMFLLAKR